jgi:hypothetical protein
MASLVFINSKEDMKWLRDVHWPNLPKKYKSALIYGNEDAPVGIEAFEKAEPLITDDPIATLIHEFIHMVHGRTLRHGKDFRRLEYFALARVWRELNK